MMRTVHCSGRFGDGGVCRVVSSVCVCVCVCVSARGCLPKGVSARGGVCQGVSARAVYTSPAVKEYESNILP